MSKQIKITPEFREAIQRASEEYTQLGLSQMTGVGQTGIGKYISGKIQKINEDNVKRLMPVLEKFLPKDAKIKMRDNLGSINQGISLGDSQKLGELEQKVIDIMKNMDVMDKVKILNFADELQRS